MDSNEQNICKCHNSATNEKSTRKSSKIIQTFSTATNDSDVFYDLPDENESSSIPKSSHRSRTSQNDRYRDHTNLSHEPNIEAPAGLRQQPAGQRQTYQAKDRYKNDGNYNGNNTNKDQSTLDDYFTPRGSCLCSNVSEDEFRNLSSEAGSSIVKLSFSTNARVDLQGSYECFCGEEEEENGTCHKFWCQRYEVLGNTKKETTVEDTMRTFESQKKMIERKEDNESRTACCSQKRILDFKAKPNYGCLCVRKSLIVSSCIESFKKEEINSQEIDNTSITEPFRSEGEEITGANFRNPLEQTNQPKVKPAMVQRSNDPSNYLRSNSERLNSNVTEEFCSCEDFENSTRLSTEHLERLQEGNQPRTPNLNESFRSVGTGITPRQTSMDENVIPLLKSIFDVLQTMREEKLHLGPIASKNIDIHLDEPFNGLPQPPPAPPSSPKFSKQFLSNSSQYQSSLFKPSRNVLKFEEETDRDFINSKDNLAILEPPERDVEAFEQSQEETITKSLRLIPVDMGLLRTDEELIWEPDSNFDKSEVKEEKEEEEWSRDLEDIVPLKAQFRQFPEATLSELTEDVTVCRGSSCPRENSHDLYNTQITESPSPFFSLKRSASMEAENCEFICQEPENCADDQIRNPELHKQKLDQNGENEQQPMNITVSEAVQVNLMSVENLTSSSAQVLKLDSQLKDLSDEKLLKISKINKSKETLLPKVNPQSNTTSTKLDVGTDCPNFENYIDTDCPKLSNDDRSSIKSCHCYQEPPTKPPKNQEMSQFIESILFDLKAMNSFRKNNSHWQSFARLPCASPGGGWQRPSRDLSYPVTIETVQVLGANSLFIKWRVQNFGNIGGYEIFLDGHLTNRYFNCIHRAAVICDVDLHCPHRITLRAQPILPLRNALPATTDSCSSSTSNTKCPSNASTAHPEASCPQPDGSVWYPSVYHYEPNSLSAAPINAVLY